MIAVGAMDPRTFIRTNTRLLPVPLVPEVRLHLAEESVPIWQKTEEELGEINVPPPYWAFAWAGGQALARYTLDHASIIAGRRVVDVGSGSGLAAIAAAMAGAAAVVASDIDGYREVVTPETAVSVPPGDVDALVGAVESLLADEPRRVAMGEAARHRAEEHFAWPDIARRLEAIYERLLTRPASRPDESVAA